MTHGATEFRESQYSAHYHANLIIIFQIKHTAASISIFVRFFLVIRRDRKKTKKDGMQ